MCEQRQAPIGFNITRKPTRVQAGVPEWVRRAQQGTLQQKDLTGR